jgi:hypothetical protein
MANDTPDPSAFFRDLIGQFAGGGGAAKPEDLARLMAGAAGATGSAQTALKAMMDRALAAANVPGRNELEELAARMSRIEAALFRIEARLGELGSNTEPR